MTSNEKDRIDDLKNELRELIEGNIMPDLHAIKRGLYGDEKNKIKGLIEINQDQHQRIQRLEKLRDRIIWLGTALLVSAQLAYDYLKAKLFGA